MLAAAVADFAQRGTDIARVRRLRDTLPGFDRGAWRQIAELGWLGILVPEDQGGLGLGLAEMAIVLEGLGRALVPEPVCAATVLAGTAIRESHNAPLRNDLLARLAAGELIPALAWQEDAGALDADATRTVARPFEAALKLSGAKRFVHGGMGADGFVVAVALAGQPALVWVPAGTAGMALAAVPLADGRSMATVTLSDAVIPKDHLLATGETARAALARALDDARVMTGAELLGVMARALEMSVDYMKTRVQFGKPIGAFQALAHRAVDLLIQREVSSAALADALAALEKDPEPRERAMIASRIKARCSDAATRIAREAIQIHGAIGFTDDYDAGLYLKRAMVLSSWLGNATAHRRRYAALMPAETR